MPKRTRKQTEEINQFAADVVRRNTGIETTTQRRKRGGAGVSNPDRPSLTSRQWIAYWRIDAMIENYKRLPRPPGCPPRLTDKELEIIRERWRCVIDATMKGPEAMRAEIKAFLRKPS